MFAVAVQVPGRAPLATPRAGLPANVPNRNGGSTLRSTSARFRAAVGFRRLSGGCGRRKRPRDHGFLFWGLARARGGAPPYAHGLSQNHRQRGVWSRLLLELGRASSRLVGLLKKSSRPCWRMGGARASKNQGTDASRFCSNVTCTFAAMSLNGMPPNSDASIIWIMCPAIVFL